MEKRRVRPVGLTIFSSLLWIVAVVETVIIFSSDYYQRYDGCEIVPIFYIIYIVFLPNFGFIAIKIDWYN